jgi:ribosomal protein S12
MSKDGLARGFIIFGVTLVIGACASSEKKQREIVREQVIASKKFYCEFLNGEKYTDIDVALNIAIGEKCDLSQQVSVTSYRSVSDIPGIIYCCNLIVKGDNDSKAVNLKPSQHQRYGSGNPSNSTKEVSGANVSKDASASKQSGGDSQEPSPTMLPDGGNNRDKDLTQVPEQSR